MQKKGLSDVVTTVLLILAVIIAISIIAGVVFKVVKSPQRQLSTEKYTLSLEVPPQSVKYGLTEQSAKSITFNVKRNAGAGTFDAVDVVLYDSSGRSKVIRQPIQLAELESKTVTVNYGSVFAEKVAAISLSPVLKSQSGEEVSGSQTPNLQVQSTDFTSTNLLDSSTWVAGTSGNQPGFTYAGHLSENLIELGVNPYGSTVALWKAENKEDANPADGGIGSANHVIDPTKTYRYSIWIKRSVSSSGLIYLGPQAYDSNHVRDLATDIVDINPYAWYGNPPQIDKWYLVVGYVYPYNTPTSPTKNGGVYDPATGQKILNSARDFKFKDATINQGVLRAFLFNSNTPSDNTYFYAPRIDLIDGKEPSISAILQGK